MLLLTAFILKLTNSTFVPEYVEAKRQESINDEIDLSSQVTEPH